MKQKNFIVIKTVNKIPQILTNTKNFHIAIRDSLTDIMGTTNLSNDEVRDIKKILFESKEYSLRLLGLDISYTIIINEYNITNYVGIITRDNKVVYVTIKDSKELCSKKMIEYLIKIEKCEISNSYLDIVNGDLKNDNLSHTIYGNLTICKK
jgi:hypothetical protein